jgi:hypothetical protein
MDVVFVIGLPVQLRLRLESAAKKENTSVTSVLTDIGKEGTFRLLPDPSDAIHRLKSYYEQFGVDVERSIVLVLPYATVPQEVLEELAVLEDLGGEVVYIDANDHAWPKLAKKARPDTSFYNDVFRCVTAELFGAEEELLSDYFKNIAERNKNILIIKDALETCDQVAAHRHKFMKASIDAFVEFISQKGKVGRIDAFFRSLGLEHAQSGGIKTTLTVTQAGKQVHQRTCQTHLKDGDNTLRSAAARVYYQEFFVKEECYVAILYAGIHPNSNVKEDYELSPPHKDIA